MNELYIYLHFPKCGGTSFRRSWQFCFHTKDYLKIYKPFNEHFEFWKNYKDKNRLKAIIGHMKMSFIKEIKKYYPNRKIILISMLRNPVDRVISAYYYDKRNERAEFHKLANQLSLYEFIEKDISKINNNCYIKYLCSLPFGNDNIDEKYLIQSKLKLNNINFGFVEDYNKSLIKFKEKYQEVFRNFTLRNYNISTNRPKSIDEKTIELIKSKNLYDIELYNYAREIEK